ncbi:uncharacterized protein LOC109826633 [Asparagus officinalis]|uniref:uncharacterized protein LOC109826633 n=1 Tax=Asparagus officinalis TaxID=4686 RepID=UPI00098E2BA9|nr:uncharacterized protein LOC109826633 [Asparagus officinalis]
MRSRSACGAVDSGNVRCGSVIDDAIADRSIQISLSDSTELASTSDPPPGFEKANSKAKRVKKKVTSGIHMPMPFKKHLSKMKKGKKSVSSLSPNWGIIYPDENFDLSSLDLPFSPQEILEAVFGLHPDKSPGPDGFPILFFQKFWHIVQADVIDFIQRLYSQPHLLHNINFSHICLIPKKEGALSPKDFRPISLINSSCKIFSKILANRLRKVLHLLIDNSQSAFQSGKSSLDSFLLGHEMINFCSSGKKEICAFKVDFYKAFDCVNWSFLQSLLKARGFGPKWCLWIHTILSSSKSAVLVNGSPTKFFRCFRGLKQGDPLSPLLFLLVANVLSKLLKCSAQSGDLSELNLKGQLNNIRSIQFADDTIIFSRATPSDMWLIKAIDKIRRNFLWNGSLSHSSIKCLISWRKVCKSKSEGGLGVLDIETFNRALLSKWLWRLFERESLISKVVFSVYSKDGSNPFAHLPKCSASRFILDLSSISSTFFSLVKWRTGDGKTGSFWHDKWSGTNSLSSLFPKAYQLALSQSCSIRSQGRMINLSWNWYPLIRRGISPSERSDQNLLLTHLTSSNINISSTSDELLWTLLPSGIYSVKSFYSLVNSGGIKSKFYSMIWRSSIPNKVKVLFWIITNKKLNTKGNLIIKGWTCDPRCSFCLSIVETHDHLFTKCPFARAIWSYIFPSIPTNSWPQTVEELIFFHKSTFLSKDAKLIWKILLPCTCWWIWFSRNALIFKDEQPDPLLIASNIGRYSIFWTGAADERLERRLRRAALSTGL